MGGLRDCHKAPWRFSRCQPPVVRRRGFPEVAAPVHGGSRVSIGAALRFGLLSTTPGMNPRDGRESHEALAGGVEMRVAFRWQENRATPSPVLNWTMADRNPWSSCRGKKKFTDFFLGYNYTKLDFSMVPIANRCHGDLPASHESPCGFCHHHILPPNRLDKNFQVRAIPRTAFNVKIN